MAQSAEEMQGWVGAYVVAHVDGGLFIAGSQDFLRGRAMHHAIKMTYNKKDPLFL